jgi:hypothetical protein
MWTFFAGNVEEIVVFNTKTMGQDYYFRMIAGPSSYWMDAMTFQVTGFANTTIIANYRTDLGGMWAPTQVSRPTSDTVLFTFPKSGPQTGQMSNWIYLQTNATRTGSNNGTATFTALEANGVMIPYAASFKVHSPSVPTPSRPQQPLKAP